MQFKKFGFIYLMSYLAIAGIGLGFIPKLTLKMLFAQNDYGEIMPRMVGALALLLSFVLFTIFRQGLWSRFSIPTLQARIPLMIFMLYLHHISGNDPLFLVLTGIIGFGVVLTLVGVLKKN